MKPIVPFFFCKSKTCLYDFIVLEMKKSTQQHQQKKKKTRLVQRTGLFTSYTIKFEGSY